jgi:uncharacterized OB-fold protein
MSATSTFPPGMPLPAITDDTRPFWDACRRRELVIQRCTTCGTFRHLPTPVCWRCRSFAHAWEPVSGRGTIFSWTVVHRAFLPGLEEAVPYTVVVVALDDAPGVRLISNLVDGEPTIGQPVAVVFEDVAPEVTVPRFRVRRA